MASLQTLERRILALEARLADVEGEYGDTLYKLHRVSVKTDLRTAKILERFHIEDVSDEGIDNTVDDEEPWPQLLLYLVGGDGHGRDDPKGDEVVDQRTGVLPDPHLAANEGIEEPG